MTYFGSVLEVYIMCSVYHDVEDRRWNITLVRITSFQTDYAHSSNLNIVNEGFWI